MSPLWESILKILIGIGLLFGGGEFFVQGAASLALIFGIPQLVIGLTVVSLGTSAPELFVSIGSFLKDSDSLAISNIVGSNIFNVLVVLGSSALVLPLKVENRLIKRDVPLLIAASAAVWGIASSGKINWTAGIFLLLALTINTVWEVLNTKDKNINPQDNDDETNETWIKPTVKILAGIILLSFGTELLVNGAKFLALAYGLSEAIIGLTIVSVGTSLPELITSLVATFRGKTDMAIGNVVGSSLLNILLVLGSCALFSGNNGISIEESLLKRDFPIMFFTAVACMPIFWTKGKISRGEGGFLLSLYLLYISSKIIPLSLPSIEENFTFLISTIIIPLIVIIIIYKSIKYWHAIKKHNLS